MEREDRYVAEEEIHQNEEGVHHGSWHRNLLCSIIFFNRRIPNIEEETHLRPNGVDAGGSCHVMMEAEGLQDWAGEETEKHKRSSSQSHKDQIDL